MLLVSAAFFATLVIGVPVAFAIGLAAATHVLLLGNLDFFNVMIQRMMSGINNSSILCIPFFILAGNLMNYGGITKRIYRLIRECVGFIKGGLAYATIIVAMMLSAILGSSNAVAAILGTSIFPELVKDNYDGDFAACLIAAGGTLGPIIPPGIGMVMMGVLCGVSVRKLFIAGILPGILIGLSYMVVAFLFTRKRGYGKTIERFSLRAFGKALWGALLSLMVPVIIVGGVIGGVFTPAEAGCVSVAIAMLCGFLYGELKVKDLPGIFVSTAITSSAILLIIAFGNVLGWTLVMDRVPATIANAVLGLTDSPLAVLFLITGAMLIIGFFIEGFSSYLIFAPVFATIASAVGIDLIHFSMLFIIMINLGVVTPPVGMVLFVSSNVTKVPLTAMAKTIWPFVAAAMVAVVLMILFPQIILVLPNILG